jgi:hypothetical protein
MILYFSTAYGMVKNTARWLQRLYGIEIVEVPITFPILAQDVGDEYFGTDASDRSYLDPLRDVLEGLQRNCSCAGCLSEKLKVAVLDHIVSIPAIKLPVLKMTEMIRNYTTTTPLSSSSSPEQQEGAVRSCGSHDHHCSGCNRQNNNNNRGVSAGCGSRSGTFVLVDGAHAWGQVPSAELSILLNQEDCSDNYNCGDDGDSSSSSSNNNGDKATVVSKLGIDAYLSNGHKWMYSPKGAAILWVHPSRVTGIFPEPTVISSANTMGTTTRTMQQGSFDDDAAINDGQDGVVEVDPMGMRYIYTSTKDYTSMLSLSRALDFQQWLGGEGAIHRYVRGLALRAKKYLIQLWNTRGLAPDSMEVYMINVVLPIDRYDPNATQVASALQGWLYEEMDMYVVIAREATSGYIYARLSAQIYLEMVDFERLGDAVLAFLSLEKERMAWMAAPPPRLQEKSGDGGHTDVA